MKHQRQLLRLRAWLLALVVLPVVWLLFFSFPLASEEIPTNQREEKAPATLTLTLKDAIRLALDNNLAIPAKRVEWKIADTEIQATRGAYDPLFYGEAYYGETVSPGAVVPLLGGLLGDAEVRTDRCRGRVGIQGKLPPGTVVDLYHSSERVETDIETLLFTPYSPTYGTELGVSITQPLLRKAWLEYGLADERMARNRRSRAHLAIVHAAEALVADVEAAYWDLVSVLAERELRRKSLELADRFYQDVRAKLKLGHATEADLFSTETDIALQRESLAIVEQQIRDGQNRLRHLVAPFNYPLAENVIVVPLDRPAVIAKRPDLVKCVEDALKNRREIQMKDIELENARVSLEKAGNELLPRLELRFTGGATSTTDSYGKSISEVVDLEYPKWEAGFYFELPLGNVTARANYRRSRYQEELLKIERSILEQQIAREVKEAANAFDTAFTRIDTNSRAVALAVKRYMAEKERYDRQHSTAYQVLQMLRDVVQAEVNLEKAKADLNKAFSRLEKATGTLLNNRGISIP